ncbi:MAG: tetratricopeptide repeat protein [Phycisphaerales bacterium]
MMMKGLRLAVKERPKARTAPGPEHGASSAAAASSAAGAEGVADPSSSSTPELRWKSVWQMPAIIGSLIVIAIGLRALTTQPVESNDFAGAYDKIDEYVEAGEYETAATLLEEKIGPHLAEASDPERGRYQATAGDILAGSMHAQEKWDAANLQQVARRYRKAREFNFDLDAMSLEHWGIVSLLLDDQRTLELVLTNLEILALDGEEGSAARTSRNRLLRRIIERTLTKSDIVDDEPLMAMIHDYRSSSLAQLEDEMWAAARAAELRIRSGKARKAVDHLFIDMRRFETRIETPGGDFGELYTLLGRAYLELGEFDFALRQIETSFELIGENDPRRAEAMVAYGRVLHGMGRFEDALAAFSTVVTEFASAPAYIAGLLGQADLLGVLGEHEESQASYARLADELRRSPRRPDVTPQIIVNTLCEQRHDAAIARAELPRALAYIELSLLFFGENDLPEPAVRRLASTNRAIADALLADARAQLGEGEKSDFRIDPDVRRQASRHYRTAGEYFVNRARSLRDSPSADQQWAESLWLAADSYDQAGYYDVALELFREYIAAHAAGEARWLEAWHRVGVCMQAIGDHEGAADAFERVLNENRKSLFAMQSHVPLAMSYRALNRPGEAEQLLLNVVHGGEPLEPESLEYRAALIDLGTLYVDRGEYPRAIEELSKAVQYYPAAPEIGEIRYRLAEAYRLNASEIAGRLKSELMPRSQLGDLQVLRVEHLRAAMGEYGHVIALYEDTRAGARDPLQQDALRNAYLYQADAAFDLGEYSRAIELYDRAAQRYASHSSSVIALIQIVNAYMAMGDRPRAETAHARALLRLQQLPEGALEGDAALLNVAAWQRWMEQLPPGEVMTQVGGNSSATQIPNDG